MKFIFYVFIAITSLLTHPAVRAQSSQAAQKVVKALDIRLKPGSSELDAESVRKLDAWVNALSDMQIEVIIAVGHTDESDGASNGLKLSTQRADAVKAYLAKRGIPANRMYAEGKGSTQPVGTANENRRVELEAIGRQVKSEMTDLVYLGKRGNNQYFTGKYEGNPVNMVRNGAVGSGKLTIYTGTGRDRVRLSIDDQKGLREILAMDTGQRITLNQVGEERIEYRLYAPDRKFIVGSVIYRQNNRWLQGMLRTEAFEGYSALSGISDVTKTFDVYSAIPATKVGDWLKHRWQNLHLISTAFAQGNNKIPSSIWRKALLAGAGLFVREYFVPGSFVAIVAVATSPLALAIIVGVGIGLANWQHEAQADTKTLSDADFEPIGRMVAETRFSNQAAPEAPTERGGETNRVERNNFSSELIDADICRRAGNFYCSDIHIANAARLAKGTIEKNFLDESWQLLRAEKEKARLASETRARPATSQASSAPATPPARTPTPIVTSSAPASPQAAGSCGKPGDVILINSSPGTREDAPNMANIPANCRTGRESNWVEVVPAANMSTREICDRATKPSDGFTGKLITNLKNMSACFCVDKTVCYTFYEKT